MCGQGPWSVGPEVGGWSSWQGLSPWGRTQLRNLFLSVPLISPSLHEDGLAKPPAWARTSEGLKAPLRALPEFLGTGRSVGRRFPRGQQATLETAPTWCVCWWRG